MEQNHMSPRPAVDGSASATPAFVDHNQGHAALHQEPRQPPSASVDRTFKLPLYPPPPYSQIQHEHNPGSLVFPECPKTELAPIQTSSGAQDEQLKNRTLPSLSSLTSSPSPLYTSPPPHHRSSRPPETTLVSPKHPAPLEPVYWPSLNPLTAYYTPSHVQAAETPLRMDVDSTNGSVAGTASPERFEQGRASSVSLDDPDVRMAAEALGDLRADFVSSPTSRSTPLPASPRSQSSTAPEPLLQLLTTSHPLLGNVIEGTQSAYLASKNYSPRFKSGAEYVEGYVTPIANTVGSVGRVTGMEGGVRWFLGRRQKSQGSDLEAGGRGSSKRRKMEGLSKGRGQEEDEPMSGTETPRPSFESGDRRLSVASTVETLPAYDEFRSPAYTEDNESRPSPTPWQSRLIMSTSGLSIAMSEESLRSLKYCLSWLRWANLHIGDVIKKLQSVLDRYGRQAADGDVPMQDSDVASSSTDGNDLAAKINALRADVLKTLQDVISTVSKYAGGALPENARILVRRHLTSLPQRFRVASMAGEGETSTKQPSDSIAEEAGVAKEKEMREGAQRVLVLAKEGLDMMAQVSGVLDGTIVSAEEWCERLGRKKREQREALSGSTAPQTPSGDVKMELQ